MADVERSDLQKCILKILKDADLTTLSSKMIRKRCEEHFDVDLLSRKQEIDEIVMTQISAEEKKNTESEDNELDSNNNSEASDLEPTKKSTSVSKSSDSDGNSHNVSHKIKKRKQDKISNRGRKENLLQGDEENTIGDSDDEALARQLQDEEWNLRRRSSKRSSVKRAVVKRKKKDEEGKVKVRKGTSTYSRKCQLSAELAEIMESSEMARPDVVKKMWSIVRERDLFDPSNRQFAICDEQLRKVFGTKRVRMFSMMKYLKNHIKDLKG